MCAIVKMSNTSLYPNITIELDNRYKHLFIIGSIKYNILYTLYYII